jgi:hypothetical protein
MSDLGRVTPSYELIPVLRTPSISPGKDIEIDLFISGSGQVDTCNLTIMHAHPELLDLDREHPGKIYRGVVYDQEGGKFLRGRECIEDSGYSAVVNTNQNGTRINISPQLLSDNSSDSEAEASLGDLERTHPTEGNESPFRICLFTDSDADPTDYEITFVLTVTKNGDVFTERESVKPHIKTYREQHERSITYAIVGSAIIALVSLVYSTGFFGFLYEFSKVLIEVLIFLIIEIIQQLFLYLSY